MLFRFRREFQKYKKFFDIHQTIYYILNNEYFKSVILKPVQTESDNI